MSVSVCSGKFIILMLTSEKNREKLNCPKTDKSWVGYRALTKSGLSVNIECNLAPVLEQEEHVRPSMIS